jgi:two-component system chemotaxis sensor kinase CheA
MKAYAPELLGPWPGDEGPVLLPDGPRARSLFPALHEMASTTLAWIAETAQGIKPQEEGAFDALYRRGHVVAGMAELLGLSKAAHVLAILGLALDVARSLGTFERHSLAYVVRVLATTAGGVLDDFQRDGRSDRDLSDVIEECRAYLAGPLQERQAPVEREKPREEALAVIEPELSAVALSLIEVDAVDDEPEELRVPPDKLGLTSAFCEESREGLAQIGYRLVELEGAPAPLPLVNDLFRTVHTIKGGARLLEIRKIEALSHGLESLLDQVRRGARRIDPGLIDVLLAGQKLLDDMVGEVASRGPIRTRIGPCLTALAAVASGQPAEARPLPIGPVQPPAVEAEVVIRPAAGADSIRIPTEKLDDVLNTASEVFISRIRLSSDVSAIGAAIRHFKQALQRLDELGVEAILRRLAESNRRLVSDLRALLGPPGGRTIVEKLAALVNRFHQELSAEVEQHGLAVPEELTLNLLSIDEVRKRLQKNVEHLEQLSGRLQTGAMSFRMVPISHLFDRFPTQVREVARQLGKKVRLEVSGSETELDKVLINQLADPLLHILRNSIDHGIEAPEDRRARGKPETGAIALRAYYHGSHAVIEVRDDGRGIDVDRVLARAIDSGLIESDRATALARHEVFDLIFAPGLSTAVEVSALSGRGVGMDVVKTAISQVQGNITVESEPGAGTMVRMKLPLTLAVVGVLLVRERSQQFAFPIQHVEEILSVKLGDIRRVSENALYNHRGTTLPVTALSSLLEFPPSQFADEVFLVVLSEGEKKVGVLVDAVLGRQEVLIKSLGRLIKKAPFVMGCTILSDSRLVLILNAWEIVNARSRKPLAVGAPVARALGARKQHAVLIVDDSAIQRNHLSSVLSHAGYMVDAVENGFEGLKRLRHRRHSAFCVDVLMPLMDGFEFVERLRRQPGHAATPVFFVTGRTSAAERERAASQGAHEYFEKPVDPDALVQALDRYCLGASQEGAGEG